MEHPTRRNFEHYKICKALICETRKRRAARRRKREKKKTPRILKRPQVMKRERDELFNSWLCVTTVEICTRYTRPKWFVSLRVCGYTRYLGTGYRDIHLPVLSRRLEWVLIASDERNRAGRGSRFALFIYNNNYEFADAYMCARLFGRYSIVS